MTRIIAPILIGASTGAADIGARLLEQQPIGITTAVTMATFVGGACLWLSRKFEQRDQALAKRDLDMSQRLTKIEQAILDLPCKNGNGDGCHRHK